MLHSTVLFLLWEEARSHWLLHINTDFLADFETRTSPVFPTEIFKCDRVIVLHNPAWPSTQVRHSYR